jgi:hypothetical protein
VYNRLIRAGLGLGGLLTHCKTCSLSSAHPGVTLDDDQVCNLCKLEVADELLHNVNYANEAYAEFQTSGANPRGPYDCLLMFSGGKDSTYLLDKFVNEYHKRVLAYTFDVPFESDHAAANVRLVQSKIQATFVIDKDDDNIKTVVRSVFNRPAPEKPGKYLDEKIPCMSCRNFFVIRAILYAYKHQIPHIIFCADPQQILTIQPDVREVVRGFYRSFGRELTSQVFGGELEELLFADDQRLPKIVFPFVAMRREYDPDRMIAELKAKDLYHSSPLETHCTLFPLLNYYSLRHWDCMFYKLNASSYLRAVKKNKDFARTTYSLKFPRAADLVTIEQRLKTTLFAIAAGEGDPVQHEETLFTLFRELEASEEGARFAARSCLGMRDVAVEMGIELGVELN